MYLQQSKYTFSSRCYFSRETFKAKANRRLCVDRVSPSSKSLVSTSGESSRLPRAPHENAHHLAWREARPGPRFCLAMEPENSEAATPSRPAARMPYAVEGETITPAVLYEEGWSIISGKYERARQTRIRKKEERLCLTQPEAGSTTPGPAQQTGKSSLVTNHNKPSTRRRRPPLSRLPEDDRKVVVRPSNLNLRMTTPGQLLKAICEQLNLPPQEIFAKDRLRINPYNNTFTISTPVKERAVAYRSLPGFAMNNQEYPVTAYFPTPEQSVRTPDEILHYCITENPELPIVNARRMGRSRAAVITFEGTKPPKEMIFQAGLFTCHPFKERVETCLNCRRVGHRADVCYRPKSQRCHRCGEEHPPPEEGEPPNCEAKCIICERPHVTGSRNCKHRFVEKRKKLQAKGPPTGDRYSLLSSEDDDNPGRRSRSRAPSSRRRRSESRSRDRSISYPPLDDRGRNSSRSKSNERKKPPSSRGNSTTQNADRQVSWASRVSQAKTGKREFLEQTRKLKEENAALRRRLDELEKLVKTGPNSTPLNTPAAARSAPPTPTQIATNNAMNADANRGTLKRQASTDLDANAKREAEASPDGEPQPKPKTTVTSQAPMRKDERFDQLEKDNQETKDSLRLVGETLQQILQRLTALDRLAALEATLLQLGLHNTLDELTEAHRRMQELRLARTNAGRVVPRRLGINAAPLNAGTRKIPSNVRKTITVKPLPKNMHPAHHEGRRRARAQALAKRFEGRTDVVYVDAAAYLTPKKAYAIAAVTEEGQLVANATRLAHPGPWENLLLSSDLETQIQAVTRAQEVAASLH
ncbi:hypothetical protein HPB47_012719 [Ixodes persulcatus]|uniref:Uncharacterized protein n=1 Tax=Ixodes persulcatus TaxID=34615 RepID=A0AC60NSR6_IXOPE|nr:hypothetical protein HPB47_012719 [Ixodes persulcatus]